MQQAVSEKYRCLNKKLYHKQSKLSCLKLCPESNDIFVSINLSVPLGTPVFNCHRFSTNIVSLAGQKYKHFYRSGKDKNE
jgi:hypothetical protein